MYKKNLTNIKIKRTLKVGLYQIKEYIFRVLMSERSIVQIQADFGFCFFSISRIISPFSGFVKEIVI